MNTFAICHTRKKRDRDQNVLAQHPEKFGPEPQDDISDEELEKYLEEYRGLLEANKIEKASGKGGEKTYREMLDRKEVAERAKVQVEEMTVKNDAMLEKLSLRRDCLNNLINDLSRVIRGQFAGNMMEVSLQSSFRYD